MHYNRSCDRIKSHQQSLLVVGDRKGKLPTRDGLVFTSMMSVVCLGVVKLFNYPVVKWASKYKQHHGHTYIESVRFSGDDKYVISSGGPRDCAIMVWKLQVCKCMRCLAKRSISPTPSNVRSLSPESPTLLTQEESLADNEVAAINNTSGFGDWIDSNAAAELVKSGTTAACMLRADRTVLDVNQLWLDAFGFTRDEIVGSNLSVTEGGATSEGESGIAFNRILSAIEARAPIKERITSYTKKRRALHNTITLIPVGETEFIALSEISKMIESGRKSNFEQGVHTAIAISYGGDIIRLIGQPAP